MKSNKYEAPSMKTIHICEEDIICISTVAPQFIKGEDAPASAGGVQFKDLWAE